MTPMNNHSKNRLREEKESDPEATIRKFQIVQKGKGKKRLIAEAHEL
jgi:hypothetical protein